LLYALARPESAVQNGEDVAEATPQTRDDLVRERNLGDEDQRLSTHLECGGNGPQIDLGLAASGDAVEQECFGGSRGDGHSDPRAGARLVRCGLYLGFVSGEGVGDSLRSLAFLDGNEPAPHELAERFSLDRELIDVGRAGVREGLQHLLLARRPTECLDRRRAVYPVGESGDANEPDPGSRRTLEPSRRDESVPLERAQFVGRPTTPCEPRGALGAPVEPAEEFGGAAPRGPAAQSLLSARRQRPSGRRAGCRAGREGCVQSLPDRTQDRSGLVT
jgi:hypothetical protein